MSIAVVRGESDGDIERILDALRRYEGDHPHAQIEAYRQNPASIRVRILDPDFSMLSRADRHEAIWRFLEDLPDEVQGQVSLLLLLTPEEAEMSFANFEFDHPVPSSL